MKHRSLIRLSLGLLLAPLSVGSALATEPCPWAGTEDSALCERWNALAERLEQAEQRADTAEQALESMRSALESMEQSLQAMQSGEVADDAGAERARALLDQALAWFDEMLAGAPVSLDLPRDYRFEADGDAYVATFDPAGLAGDGGRLDFGPLRARITPLDADRARIELRLSDSVTVREGETVQAELAIGSQSLQGIWSNRLQAFADAELRLGGLQLAAADAPFDLRIGLIAGAQQLEVDAEDAWEQSQHFALDELQFSMEGQTVTLAAIESTATANGTGYTRLRALSEEIQQLGEQTTETGVPPMALFEAVKEMFDLFGHYALSLEAREFQVTAGDQPLAQIQRFELGSALREGENGASLGFSTGISGVTTPLSPLPPGLTPHAARFELSLDNIPPNLLDEVLRIGMASDELPGPEQEAFWQQQLLQLLMGSGFQLRIVDTYVAADDSRADLSLRAAVAPESMFGGTGELTLQVTGMQKLIDVTGVAQDQSIAPVLAMLTALSDRTEQDGTTVDTFDLRVTPDGKLMLNGKDVTAMAMGGAPPPAE